MDLSTVREELNVSYMSGYNFHDECDKNFTDFRRRWVITRIPTNLPRTFDSFLRTQRTTIPTKSHEFMPWPYVYQPYSRRKFDRFCLHSGARKKLTVSLGILTTRRSFHYDWNVFFSSGVSKSQRSSNSKGKALARPHSKSTSSREAKVNGDAGSSRQGLKIVLSRGNTGQVTNLSTWKRI